MVDGKMYGALPRCSECGGGLLRVVYKSKYGHGGQGKVRAPPSNDWLARAQPVSPPRPTPAQFSCPGYYDDDEWKRCSFVSDGDIARSPWVDDA